MSSTSYKYEVDGELKKVKVAGSRTSLGEIKFYFPGVIKIENNQAWAVSACSGGSYSLDYEAKVTSNRDLPDVLLIIHTTRPDGQYLKVACPVGTLRKGKSRRMNFTVNVPEDYVDCRYRAYYMCRGFEVLSIESEFKIPTPYARTLTVEGKEAFDDGPPRVVSIIKPVPPVDAEGVAIPGTVKMKLLIDASGYVIKVEPLAPKQGPHVQAALDVLYLWEFVPRISDGMPVESELVVPLSFE